MKIVFDLTDLYDHLTGIERYAMELSYHMITRHKDNTYVLIFKERVHKRFAEIVKRPNVRAVVIKKCNKLLFRQVVLPAKLSSIRAGAYIFPAFPEPWISGPGNVITAVHDMACWDCGENMKALSAWYFRLSNIHTFFCARNILTVSNFSKKRIEAFVSQSSILKNRGIEDRILLVPDGFGGKRSINAGAGVKVKEKYNLPDRYILTLSTLEPRKNLALLLKAYGQLITEGNDIPDLCLAGRSGWKIEKILSAKEDFGSEVLDKIHFLGFIEDNDLPYLYKGADYFVFPSKYEGFGLPPLEALGYGCKVLSSDASAMREILRKSVWYFKNNDIENLKSKMIELCNVSHEETLFKKKYAKVVLARYTWENAADRLYNYLCR